MAVAISCNCATSLSSSVVVSINALLTRAILSTSSFKPVIPKRVKSSTAKLSLFKRAKASTIACISATPKALLAPPFNKDFVTEASILIKLLITSLTALLLILSGTITPISVRFSKVTVEEERFLMASPIFCKLLTIPKFLVSKSTLLGLAMDSLITANSLTE